MLSRFVPVYALVDPEEFRRVVVDPDQSRLVRSVYLATGDHLPRDYCDAHFADVVLSEGSALVGDNPPKTYSLTTRRRVGPNGLVEESTTRSLELQEAFQAAYNSLDAKTFAVRQYLGGDLGYCDVMEYLGGPLDGVFVAHARIPAGQPADLVDFVKRQASTPWPRGSGGVLPPWLLRRTDKAGNACVEDVTADRLDLVAAGILGDDGSSSCGGRFRNLARRLPPPRLVEAEVERAARALLADAAAAGVLRPMALSGDLRRLRDSAGRLAAARAELRDAEEIDRDKLAFGGRLATRIGAREAFDLAVADRCAALLGVAS